jgi:hypothetical protein
MGCVCVCVCVRVRVCVRMSSKCLDKTQISMCDAVLLEIWEKIAELVIHTIPTEQALANAQQQPLFYPLYVSRSLLSAVALSTTRVLC